MDKKIKGVILFLGAYLLVFWIGFKSGTIYLRTQNKVQVERIEIPAPPPPVSTLFYLVERRNYGSYSAVNVDEISADSVTMKMFKNEKLRPLLKLRDIEIYDVNGEKIY